MRTNAFLFMIPLFLLLITACDEEKENINPSDNTSIRTHSITAFTDLKIEDPFVVYVKFSNTEESLRIEANDNLHAFIDVRQSGEALAISLDEDVNFKIGNVVLKVYLTTKDIKVLEASGATNVILQDPLIGEDLEIELEGASKLSGRLQLDFLDAYLNGASIMDIEGSAQKLDISAIGASHMTDFDFATDELYVDLSGASTVSLQVNQTLEVKATGASTVYYQGNGVVENINVSGGSNVIKVE